jgi:glycerate kinase
MRVVFAPDSFKECASADEVAQALALGWLRVFPDAETVCVPMADGGEGSVDALVAATNGVLKSVCVTGPLGDLVEASYGFLGGGDTAVIEMAAASGLPLAPRERRDPRVATTRGTGELICDALNSGARKIIVGIGGSATNDGGAGMAQALGFSLLDAEGRELPPGGAALLRLARIDASGKHRGLDGCEIFVACDVTNPLHGPNGASRVYGPQKGADPEAVEELDSALRHFGAIIEEQLGVIVSDVPGGGAAGGLGAGLLAFASARLRPGVELVADASGLAERMRGADLVITGEGRMDAQTSCGKTPVGVARISKGLGIPVLAIVGSLGDGYRETFAHGVDAAFSICCGPMELGEATVRGKELLADAAENAARLWRCAAKA